MSFYLITDNQNFHLQIRFFQRRWVVVDGFLATRRNTLNNLSNKLLLWREFAKIAGFKSA